MRSSGRRSEAVAARVCLEAVGMGVLCAWGAAWIAPEHGALGAGLGMAAPLVTRAVAAASRWLTRASPLRHRSATPR